MVIENTWRKNLSEYYNVILSQIIDILPTESMCAQSPSLTHVLSAYKFPK